MACPDPAFSAWSGEHQTPCAWPRCGEGVEEGAPRNRPPSPHPEPRPGPSAGQRPRPLATGFCSLQSPSSGPDARLSPPGGRRVRTWDRKRIGVHRCSISRDSGASGRLEGGGPAAPGNPGVMQSARAYAKKDFALELSFSS